MPSTGLADRLLTVLLITRYPSGAGLATINEPESDEEVIEVNDSDVGCTVGATHDGGGVKVNVIPAAGLVLIVLV